MDVASPSFHCFDLLEDHLLPPLLKISGLHWVSFEGEDELVCPSGDLIYNIRCMLFHCLSCCIQCEGGTLPAGEDGEASDPKLFTALCPEKEAAPARTAVPSAVLSATLKTVHCLAAREGGGGRHS